MQKSVKQKRTSQTKLLNIRKVTGGYSKPRNQYLIAFGLSPVKLCIFLICSGVKKLILQLFLKCQGKWIKCK